MYAEPIREFYVYRLIDPRDGSTFYIGKGMGNRMYHHQREAERGVKSRKCFRILEILSAGLSVTAERVRTFTDEQEAYDYEKALIAEIGLSNLTNVHPGGQSAWHDRHMAWVARENRKAEKVFDSTRVYLRKMLAIWDTWPNGGTFPNLPNGDEKAEKYIQLVRKMCGETWDGCKEKYAVA